MKRIFGFTLLILGITLYSCQTEKLDTDSGDVLFEKSAQITLTEIALESVATEIEYEVDFYANAEQTLTNLLRLGKLWKWTDNLRYKFEQCPDIDIESEEGGYPKTITLNYGDSTVLSTGRVLSGIITVEISGPKFSVDYNRQIIYRDFGVDSLLINGTSLVTVDKGEDVFRTITSDFAFLLANGISIDRTSERVWEWVAGMDTEEDQNDDVIQITGFANAETSEGDVYRKDILEPLIRLRDCHFIVQGIVEITIITELISTLDYGNGACNNIAILTKDGETYEVDLGKRKVRK